MHVGKRGADHFRHLDLERSNSIITPPEVNKPMNKNKIISIAAIVLTVLAGAYILSSKNDSLFKKGSNGNTAISNVQLKFAEKNYKMDYFMMSADTVLKLYNFDKSELWQGAHEIDDTVNWDAKSSLLLTSKENSKHDVYLNKKINLDKYQVFKIAINVNTDPAEIDSFKIYFSNKEKNAYYSYPVRNLSKGWNFLTIQKMKFSATNAKQESLIVAKPTGQSAPTVSKPVASGLTWANIERFGFEFSSRANSVSSLNLDVMKAITSEDYLDDWMVINPQFLDLTSYNGKTILQAKNYGATSAVIKKLSGLTDFTFKVKVLPQKPNTRSGLFIRGDYRTGYGYYFLVDGLNGSRWQIFKIGLVEEKTAQTILKNGIINNFMVEEDKPLYIKAEVKGATLKFFLSTDNNTYTLLGEVNDGEFKEGSVGVSVYDGGMSLFDEFELNQ